MGGLRGETGKKKKRKKEKKWEDCGKQPRLTGSSSSMLGLWYLLQLHISLRFGPLDGQEFVPSQGKREKVKTSLTDYSPRLPCNERHVDSQAATSNEAPISPINRLTSVTLHWCNSSMIKKEQWQSKTEVANDCAIVSPSTMQKYPPLICLGKWQQIPWWWGAYSSMKDSSKNRRAKCWWRWK